MNENHPIHHIHLSLKKDPFPSISYSHIPVRNSRAAPPGSEMGSGEGEGRGSAGGGGGGREEEGREEGGGGGGG